MHLLAKLGALLHLGPSTQPNTQGICERNAKTRSLNIKGRRHATSPGSGSNTESFSESMAPKTRSVLKERPRRHTNPTTATEACDRQQKKKGTGHIASVAWPQEPVRNVRKLGPILTRDSGQIRVRVACSTGSEKAGQPPCGFVAASAAALHGVAANCPSTSPRRLRPRSRARPFFLCNSGESRVTTTSFTG